MLPKRIQSACSRACIASFNSDNNLAELNEKPVKAPLEVNSVKAVLLALKKDLYPCMTDKQALKFTLVVDQTKHKNH